MFTVQPEKQNMKVFSRGKEVKGSKEVKNEKVKKVKMKIKDDKMIASQPSVKDFFVKVDRNEEEKEGDEEEYRGADRDQGQGQQRTRGENGRT